MNRNADQLGDIADLVGLGLATRAVLNGCAPAAAITAPVRRQPRVRAPWRGMFVVGVADLVGYSDLVERDELCAYWVLMGLRGRLRHAAEERGGRIVEEIGDAVVALFDDAAQAAGWAQQAHDAAAMLETRAPAPGAALRLRIGVERGEVLSTRGRLYGRTLVHACRLQTAAAPGGTMLGSGAALALLEGSGPPQLDGPHSVRICTARSVEGWELLR